MNNTSVAEAPTVVTIGRMAKKTGKVTDAPKTVNRSGKPLHVRIEGPLRDAIEKCRKSNKRSLTGEVSLALEKHLADQGFWPPKEE